MKDNLTFQSKKYFCNSKISLLNIFFIEVSLDQSKVQNLRHSSQQEAMRLELPFTPKFYIWMKQQSCNTKSVKCLVQSAVQWLVSRTKEMYWGDLELGDIECNNLMLNLKYQSPVNREPCRQWAGQYQSLLWKKKVGLLESTNIDRISVDARATAMLILSTSHLTFLFIYPHLQQ